MVRIVYYKCDRCGKDIGNFEEVKMMMLLSKTREFCDDCAEDFHKWYSAGKKSHKKGNVPRRKK